MRLIGILLIALWLVPGSVSAGSVGIDRDHSDWESAMSLENVQTEEQVRFGQLTADSPNRFYTWSAQAEQQVTISLAIPTSSDKRFRPQLVLFQPSDQTFGPILPFEQPPSTMALVYPAKEGQRIFEGLTQSTMLVQFSKSITLSETGQYFLAVYPISEQLGTYRLTIRGGDTNEMSALAAYPQRWWYSQIWAGLSVRTVFLPSLVIGIVAGAWWLVGVRVRKKATAKAR